MIFILLKRQEIGYIDSWIDRELDRYISEKIESWKYKYINV